MLKEKMELVGSVDIADDVQKRVETVGIRGLDFEKAKELGVFQRIGNLLTVMHATMSASNMIYGHASNIMSELHGRRNEIAKEMNLFEKSYERFLNFWTDYYANGSNGKEVRHETENLYHRIMEWAELPESWQLGEPQRTKSNSSSIAIRIESESEDRIYTFRSCSLNHNTLKHEHTWGVLEYDTETDRQTVIHTDIDKSSALMVAKRLSAENKEHIYTAASVADVTEERTEVTPFKSFRDGNTIGNVMKVEKNNE